MDGRRGLRHKGKNGDQGSHSDEEKRPLKRFCKMIVPDILEDKKLRIPNKFVREFEDELSDVAMVDVQNSRTWQIGLTKVQKSIWFDDGWHEFVEYYSICSGYLLVFGYSGFSRFSVIICDMTACEIEYALNCPGRGEGLNNDEKHSQENGDDELMLSSTLPSLPRHSVRSAAVKENASKLEYRKRRVMEEQNLRMNKQHNRKDMKNTGKSHPQPKMERDVDNSNNMFTSGLRKASQESEGAIREARMFKTKNPSLLVVLRPHNLYNKVVYLPEGFARSYPKNVSTSTCIKVHTCDGREWIVRALRCRAGLSLGAGWNSFSMENSLREGDVLVFEWIKNNFELQVTIFPAVHEDELQE